MARGIGVSNDAMVSGGGGSNDEAEETGAKSGSQEPTPKSGTQETGAAEHQVACHLGFGSVRVRV